MRVSVVVPAYNVSSRQLSRCLKSVWRARCEGDDVTLFIDGPPTWSESELSLPTDISILQSRRLGLVGSWNHCLKLARAELVHLMHCDDELVPTFYSEVRRAFEGDPAVSLCGTGSTRDAHGSRAARTRVLKPTQSARFLLSAMKPATGSFVMRREVLEREPEWFSERWPYCPDEELFLRLAARGKLAYIGLPLFRSGSHPGQARLATWRRPDFPDVYFSARMAGAAAHGDEAIEFARCETASRLLSVAAALLCDGEPILARRHLDRLATLYPPIQTDARYAAGWALCRLPGGSRLAAALESRRPAVAACKASAMVCGP